MKKEKEGQILPLEPIIKWPGGKERELSHIIHFSPKFFSNFYEPFVGGGSVFMAMNAHKYFINDFSNELISLYNYIQTQNKSFFHIALKISESWNLLDLVYKDLSNSLIKIYRQFNTSKLSTRAELTNTFITEKAFIKRISDSIFSRPEELLSEFTSTTYKKMLRMKKLETSIQHFSKDDIDSNLKTALKNSFYISARNQYNKELSEVQHIAIFFFIRNFAYSGMFRYNSKGNFNVPYGGLGYNKKNLSKKLEYYQSQKVREHLKKSNIFNLDFEEFLKRNPPQKQDFIFLDPPYDTEFSTYATNSFSKEDQKRLANYLINECAGKWMLVIKATEFINNLYVHQKHINIQSFEKKYSVNFMNRNDRHAVHLIVRNYV